ncbi:hypothetical protein llap_3216 [Limosa lapponica baueri]|uniref:Endonuclease/exonuclease/phosphatase domain-containing protein n=1 Tax=Limosa lapponica baueri TaxID=1758121 RepID=A0A2I0UKC4_LIMLA|nr:hypothetical protein llap_3216 [Limosa lapponica baueri]
MAGVLLIWLMDGEIGVDLCLSSWCQWFRVLSGQLGNVGVRPLLDGRGKWCRALCGWYVMVGVCYRPSDEDEGVDKALYRQIGATLRSQPLAFMGDFNHPSICWKDNTAGHKKSRKFSECVDDNLLLQMVEEPARKRAMLDFVLTKKEGVVGNIKLKASLGCSDHEIVEFKILRTARGVCSKLATLDFRRADFGLLMDLLGRVTWEKAP